MGNGSEPRAVPCPYVGSLPFPPHPFGFRRFAHTGLRLPDPEPTHEPHASSFPRLARSFFVLCLVSSPHSLLGSCLTLVTRSARRTEGPFPPYGLRPHPPSTPRDPCNSPLVLPLHLSWFGYALRPSGLVTRPLGPSLHSSVTLSGRSLPRYARPSSLWSSVPRHEGRVTRVPRPLVRAG